MLRSVMRLSAVFGLATLAGCGMFGGEDRAAWRGEAERACLRSGIAQSPKIKAVPSINGNGPCGMDYPLKVEELPQSKIALSRPTTMACPMIPALDNWVQNVVQPAALQHFGQPVVEVQTVGSYNCRKINGSRNWSEHSYGNAMDVSGFKLADGRRIIIGKDVVKYAPFMMSAPREQKAFDKKDALAYAEEWNDLETFGEGPALAGYGEPVEDMLANPFIESVRKGACENFSTVIGPGSKDGDHEDHLHIDLARYMKAGKKVCR